MSRCALYLVGTAVLALASPPAARGQALHLIPGVEEIASDSIADLAVALVDREQPAIYYNPRLARRYGPELTRFFLAHEYGHFAFHHTRAGLGEMPFVARDSILRLQELEADCYASRLEGPEARVATETALRFFARLGPFRFDNEHPTGAQRASRILTCLPGPRPAASSTAQNGLEQSPVSGEPERIRFAVALPATGETGYGVEAEVWVQGTYFGTVSNLRLPAQLSVEHLGAGLVNYRLTLAVYRPEGEQQFVPSGTVSGSGHLAVRNGDRFQLSWVPGEAPRLVPLAAGSVQVDTR
jgi:hypothetical protein